MSRRIRELVATGALPCLTLGVFLAYPSRQYHWDVLERAYLLEHPGRYLHSWDGSPRSLFLSFAHLLELPLAAVIRGLSPRTSGLQALCILEAIMAAVTLFVLGNLVRRWRNRLAVDSGDPTRWRAPTWRAVWLAQATFAAMLAFWKLGSSGQEKMLALATQLYFLDVFWNGLTTTGRTGSQSIPWRIAAALAIAIWSHLSGAVLVPFALAALLALPPASRPQRRRVARAVVAGAALAGIVYWLVAAWTAGVRGPASFFDYLTFFHRAGGNNFWEPAGAAAPAGSHLVRVCTGLAAFVSGRTAVGAAVLSLLAGGIVAAAWRQRRSRHTTLCVHAAILTGLWTAHFAFFEPQNFESWTLVVALAVLVAAASLPAGRTAWLAAAVPVALGLANLPHYVANHRPLQLEASRQQVASATRPGDIVVLIGGIQNGKPLRGGLTMRYFLATLGDRTIVSLYDVMGITERDYWERPFESPAALQRAIDSGHRAVAPLVLAGELARARDSGLIRLEAVASPDSVLEIQRIAAP